MTISPALTGTLERLDQQRCPGGRATGPTFLQVESWLQELTASIEVCR